VRAEHPDDEMLQPPRISPPRRASPSRARTEHAQKVSEEFDDLLAGLDFGPDQHKIIVARLEPTFDPETGEKINGVLDTFQRKVTVEDIKNRYGGGVYKVTVRGPREDTGRGSTIKAHKTIDIAGEPKPLPNSRREQRERREREENSNQLVSKVMESQERLLQKTQRDAERSQENMLTLFKELAIGKNGGDDAALAAIRLDMQRRESDAKEARERDEQRRRDEKAERERKEAAEREERKAREEEARRRHDLEMEQMRQQFQLQLEQTKAQAAAVAQQAKADSQAQQKNMEMMIGLVTKTDTEKEARSREQMGMQMQMQQSFQQLQMETTKSMQEMQMRVLTEQLKDARNKDGFLEQLEKFQFLKEFMDGKDERTGFERAVDKLSEFGGEVAPYIMGGLSARQQTMQQPDASVPNPSTPGAPVEPSPPPPGGGPRRLMPGSVAVVDDIDAALARHGTTETSTAPPALPPPQEAVAEEENVIPDVPNDLIEFVDPIPDGSNEEVLEILVKSIDLGLQRGMGMEEIYAHVIDKLPETKKQLLLALDADTILTYIRTSVPEAWPIRSFGGEQMLRDLHARLVAQNGA
jgi:hypothetical protein